MTTQFNVRNVTIGGEAAMFAIIGPCQIESRDHAMFTAETIAEICRQVDMPFIYKSSYDKANRSSHKTQRGVGIEEGLRILDTVSCEFDCPTLTDVHDPSQCAIAAEVVDVLQIPAFLSRQTDLLLAAGETGAAINVKKSQMMAPWDAQHAADKVRSTGNTKVMLCDRGTSFGYNTLVSDFRSIPIMAETGCPVIFDATHSVQQPGGLGGSSGGERRFVAPLARAATAVGCHGLFVEAHENPDRAPSDGPNMVHFDDLKQLLTDVKAIESALNR